MSGISSITNSLTSSLLSSLLSGSTSSTDDLGSGSSSADSDIVSLLDGSSSGGDSSLYNILSGSQGSDSTNSMYDILLSAESASMMQANPGFVQDILSADQAAAGSGTSSGSTSSQATSTQDLVQQLENTNLLTMSTDTLTSLLEKNIASQSSSNGTNSST